MADRAVMPPPVDVPADPDLAEEPARTIGSIFADKVMIRTAVAALAGIVSFSFKLAIDDTMIDNITTFITFVAFAGAALFAQLDARNRAKAQAEETRDAVYAPATVEAREKAIIETTGRVIPGGPNPQVFGRTGPVNRERHARRR